MNIELDREKILRDRLIRLSPEHDTPVGLIHPYWARKPFNVVETIIDVLSERGDIVADLFMGSGTTVFAALSKYRNVIASDLNPLAVFIVLNILSLRKDPTKKMANVARFVEEYATNILPWFQIESGGYIERERFIVNGSYEHGQFSLTPTETVIKERRNGKWTMRRVLSSSKILTPNSYPRKLLKNPVNFDNYVLVPNSRIAIPNGARLSHFYSQINRAAINFALSILERKEKKDSKQLLKFLLSSALPLVRLSDKKASSQWPYWRPRQMLTSRNPAIILEQRLDALRDAARWVSNLLPEVVLTSPDKVKKCEKISCAIRTLPAQDIFSHGLRRDSVDLIVTDPPYADQAPYLEYSFLWKSLLGLKQRRNAYELEIVKTDAPSRAKDSSEYLPRLCKALENCCKLLKNNRYMVLFYQDTDLQHWAGISKVLRHNGLQLRDIIPMPKQRRSIKTVVSPGNTLDGDLICVFKKVGRELPNSTSQDIGALRKRLGTELYSLMNGSTFFERYAYFIKFCLKEGSLFEELSREERHISKWLKYDLLRK
jgi:DNA modification methylase